MLVRAFGISFLALPRSPAASEAHESPAVMLVPLGFLATLCVILGLFPASCSALEGVTASLPGLQPPAAMMWDGSACRRGHVVRSCRAGNVRARISGRIDRSTALTGRRAVAVRQAPRGDAVELTPRSEHGNGILETAADDLWCGADPLGRSMPWRRSRHTSSMKFVTVRRSNRRSSAISAAARRGPHGWRDEGVAGR